MIPEITILTFLYAFKIPGINAQIAPASPAAIKQIIHNNESGTV